MKEIQLKEVGSTGLLISSDGLTVYYEDLNEWYDYPTEAPSDYKWKYFYVPHRVWVDGLDIRTVHQAVAMAWEPESFAGKDKPDIHHCNFKKFDNDVDNLIVLDRSSHMTLHCLIGDKPVSKAEAEDLLRRYESIPWEEAFEKYQAGELKTYQEVVGFIKERMGVEIGLMTVYWKFKELNGGLNPSGRKTPKTREFISLSNPALIEAFHKYQAGELKNQFAVIDFIKERTGVEIRQSVVSWKFKQLNGGLNPSGHKISKTYKTREFISLSNPALIEAFHKYQAGELKNRLEAIDFIKERTGISVTGMTVSRKFKQLRESL